MVQLKSCVRLPIVSLLVVLPFPAIPVAVADPAPSARITGVDPVNDRWVKISVYSPSMDKVIVNDVYRAPGNASAPVLYLLNGIDGGVDNKGWFGLTNVQGFFANKNVNNVSPIGGQYSYYTDWVADDPALGRTKWQTYLSQELPPVINQELKANGRNAVGGLSMSGGSALDLAIQAPGLYRATGSYSGCPSTSDPQRANQIALSFIPSGANAANSGAARRTRLGDARPVEECHQAEGRRGVCGRVDGRRGRGRQPAAGLPDTGRRTARRGHHAGLHMGVRRRRESRRRPDHVRNPAEGAHTWGLFESEMQESWNTVIGPPLGAA